ncbi:UNVERIFIED_CONTAM: 7-dehydrocholesterol reductase [Sesamum calycinum]|uniref:7-dehydrocholesterol reductase n=1 Tax=Sesamum calycinum TaxID=2727403 RepID=A0AAW2NEA2_9LAMI
MRSVMAYVGGAQMERVKSKKKKRNMGSESKMVHSPMVTYASMLSLLALCPPFVILLWYTMVHADGSVLQTWDYLRQHGLRGFISIWPQPTATAWKIIACYAAFEAALQLLLPGKGLRAQYLLLEISLYKANGVLAYAVTMVTYVGLWWFGIFDPSIVYDHLGEIFQHLYLEPCLLCFIGQIAPSSIDSGSSGNIIIDFYWIWMMSWAVLAVTYCIKQYETYGRVADSMLVNTILMLVYVTKFFWWEAGYWNTMDIAHDRAGFYICWGCLVWVPSVYTSPGMYLVNHPVTLGVQLALYILVAGILCVYINYDCDRQRQEFRRTNGKCLVWGKLHPRWGLARHFHYVPEILGAFFWTLPALFNHFLPYFYVVFLTILLFDRAKRDDDRCKSKYGKYWKLYCDKVPYRIIRGFTEKSAVVE